MFRGLFLVAALAGPALAALAADPITVRVVTPDGKPAAGATAWYFHYRGDGKPAPETPPLKLDAAGSITLPPYPDPKSFHGLFVRDAAGSVTSQSFYAMQETPESARTLTLLATAPRAGRVTTADGKPVAAAKVRLTGLEDYSGRRERPADDRRPQSISYPPWVSERQAVTTDADGRFTLPAAADYSVAFRVTAEGFGESYWTTGPGEEFAPVLMPPGRVNLTVTGIDADLLKGRTWRFSGLGRQVGPGTHRNLFKSGDFDGTATISVADLGAGRYSFQSNALNGLPAVLTAAGGFHGRIGQGHGRPAQVQPGRDGDGQGA